MSDPTTPPEGPAASSAKSEFVTPLLPSETAGTSLPDIADIVAGSQGRPRSTSGSSLGRTVIVGGLVGVVVIAGGAFLAGRALAAGPATLVDAVQQATAGTLPCGTPSAGTGGGAFLTRLCGNGGATGTGDGAANAIPGGQGGFGGGGFGGGGFGRGLAGTVKSINSTSITITTRAGDVTVVVPASTPVSKTVAGALPDVKVGATVTVGSTTDAQGNRVASRITLVPADQLPTGGPGQPGQGG